MLYPISFGVGSIEMTDSGSDFVLNHPCRIAVSPNVCPVQTSPAAHSVWRSIGWCSWWLFQYCVSVKSIGVYLHSDTLSSIVYPLDV